MSSLHCTFPPSPPHPVSHPLPPISLPPGWKAILVVDWRMMLLLRESLHQRRGRRGEREKLRRSSGSLGRCSCDGWAVKRPIVQITQQAPCHHPGLIYGAVRYGTDIALWVESAGETREGEGCRDWACVEGGLLPDTFQRGRTGFQTCRPKRKPQLASCQFCVLYASRPQWQVSIWMCVMLLWLHAHPLPAKHTRSPMHKHFNTVLKRPSHTEASCSTSLAVITTGPFSTNWHAHSLVTRHTPGCPKPDRAIILPHTDRWAVEWSAACQRRRVALPDPSLCPIAWCGASTSANWPRAAGSLILPPVKGQRIRMQKTYEQEMTTGTQAQSHLKTRSQCSNRGSIHYTNTIDPRGVTLNVKNCLQRNFRLFVFERKFLWHQTVTDVPESHFLRKFPSSLTSHIYI